MENFLMKLLNPALIWVLIPITWLLLTTVVEILKLAQRHRERIAMINQGMHPDLEAEVDAEPAFDPANRETVTYESVNR